MSQAIILAGGKGTRLKPYSTIVPKPLMPVGDVPILEVILRQLKRAGIREVILACGHMSQLFQAFFQDGKRLGVKIEYSFEEEPLGTAGPIALALDRLSDDFLVMNGDLLTTLGYERLLAAHRSSGAAATIALCRRDVKVDFGVVETTKEGRLARYVEKPTYHFDVSMGVNVFSRSVVRRYVEAGKRVDIPELMTRLEQAGEAVHTYREDCFWLDIGRIDDYQAATEIFEARRGEFLGPDA